MMWKTDITQFHIYQKLCLIFLKQLSKKIKIRTVLRFWVEDFLDVWDHLFSAYAEFSEKLTFFTP